MKSRRAGKNVLITAGPTREWMDPVRFLSNPSSGAMGIAIANNLSQQKHRVTLVLGPTNLSAIPAVKTIRVETALEMASAVKRNLKHADAFIATAAVGDWRFSKTAMSKLKKGRAGALKVTLVKNPDILALAGKSKRGMRPLLVGFSLETNDIERHAREKLRRKNLDLIIANRPNSFSSHRIAGTWIEKSGTSRRLPSMGKKVLARKIAQWLERQWKTIS